MGTTHFSGLNLKLSAIAEGSAGGFTVTGIKTEDKLLAVMAVTLVLGEATHNTVAFTTTDLTAEFSISADNEIYNTGGTDLTDMFAFVLWLDKDAS